MRKLYTITLFCLYLACPIPLLSQDASHALFVENAGQWQGDFDYKLKLSSGALFFDNHGFTLNLLDPKPLRHDHSDHHHSPKKIKGHTIKMKYLGANPNSEISGHYKTEFYYNYIHGNNSENNYQRVRVFKGLKYKDIYPGIDIRYFGSGENLKYDFIVDPGADPDQIQMKYEGASKLTLKNGQLHINTSVGSFSEKIPSVYQIINGERIEIKAKYFLRGNVVSFRLGDYYTGYELIIDPTLVFSSFTGSSANNWGFTATYDNFGNTFAGGIVWNDGGTFPTNVGAYLTNFQGAQGDIDLGISKFSSDGSQLIYSTFIGGNGIEIPQSLVVDDLGNLYILGATGSDDFPMLDNSGVQTNFGGGVKPFHQAYNFGIGTDAFIALLSADGTNLSAATYFGGSENDGLNLGLYQNYGDDARGEIIFDDGNVFIITNSNSGDISLKNSYLSNNQGQQDMIIASFTRGLDSLRWGTYFGGADDDAGYSIKKDAFGSIVIAGGTKSQNINSKVNALNSNPIGGIDGYVAKFDANSGSFLQGTYIGTSQNDQVFFVDLDKDQNVYLFGQSKGSVNMSTGKYSNPGSEQFLKKLSNNIQSEIWSTQIGSGMGKSDLVPSAFLIDDCYNIYLSGWNGNSNRIILGGNPLGNTNSLPTSPDAAQNTTDGSDFYFMVLDRDATNLEYASYFGGTSNEHVDGGTSRFDPNGSIFQAVCAGCGSGTFPTTPGAYSQANGTPIINGTSQCNLGVIKMDFEITVRSIPEIDLSLDIDTVCDSIHVRFKNSSVNADLYQWDFDNGETSNSAEPTASFGAIGNYNIRLIALDTNCGISDTSYVELDHTGGSEPDAAFKAKYFSCDTDFQTQFNNLSRNAHLFEWDFGDGNVSFDENPRHNYSNYGSYIVKMRAFDSVCFKFSNCIDTIVFADTVEAPSPFAKIASCGDGSIDVQLINNRKRFNYFWDFGADGTTSNDQQPLYYYSEPGKYTIRLKIEDPKCGLSYSFEYPVAIDNIAREMFIPNAFTPNGDNLNETFEIFGNQCGQDDEIRIFNRWGEQIFYSNKPFEEFWDAKTPNNSQAPMGVYTYSIRNGTNILKGYFTLIR